jgi:hypothetical protein
VAEKKKYEEVEMPDAAELFPPRMAELAGHILELQEKKKELETLIEQHKAEAQGLIEEVADAASWSARGDGWTVSYVKPGPRETLVKELLVQQGVSLKQIEKATKKTESKPYVTFRAMKVKESDES